MSKDKISACGGCAKKTSIGGQALIEGIMMRGPEYSAMAVRDPDGKIVLEKWRTTAKFNGKFFKLPFIRGIFNFIDSMASGYKCLMRSAEIAGFEDDEPKKNSENNGTSKEAAPEKVDFSVADAVENDLSPKTDTIEAEKSAITEKSSTSGPLMTVLMAISAVLGVALAIGLFMVLPTFLYDILAKAVPAFYGNRFLKSLFEGIFRIIIFLAYMLLVSRMKDIRRTFMYHGAEHKTIFCYEHGNPLTVENVRKEKRFHPRCGTSFMVLMLIVGIVVGMFIPASIPTLLRSAIKILLLPITMGIGYELIKLAGRHDNAFTRIISAPGMWVQHITTIEPDDGMIECAIKAFNEVLPENEKEANW
ncbi:MAG: DUF1385 domain-containing protein [Clostridia bacterium]|nr:DUF1385 domain-containing protein [Clostridia bacterium]